MVLFEYEKLLKTVNPAMRVKKYGTSLAGIHVGNKYIIRIPQGEILEHNVYEMREGFADQYKSTWNPLGRYFYNHMTRRGRREAAQILYTQGVIHLKDIAKII